MLVWSSGINAVNSLLMKNQKSRVTNSDASPSIVVPANTVDMRIRKRFKAENEKLEDITVPTPARGAVSIERDPYSKQLTELCSWRGKKKRTKPRKKHYDGVKHDYEIDILVQDKKSIVKEPLYRHIRKNNGRSNEEAVQSEIKSDVAMVALPADTNFVINICSPQLDRSSFFLGDGQVDINLVDKHKKDDGVMKSIEMGSQKTSEARVITYARRKKKGVDVGDGFQRSEGKNEGVIYVNNLIKEATERCFDEDKPIVDDSEKILVRSEKENPNDVLTEKADERRISVEDKIFDDECGNHSPEEEGGTQSSLLLSDSSHLINDTTQVEKDGNNVSLEIHQVDNNKHSVETLEEIVGLSKSENLSDVIEKAGENGIPGKDKASNDECGKKSPEELVDSQSSLLLSNSSNLRNDTSQVEKDGNNLSLERPLVASPRKKLLVLDLNGLIAEIVRYIPERHATPDMVISMKAVFKRPFYEDFMKFCFARFTVGIWSSRAKNNVDSIVDFLLGDAKQNLLFCWDQSHCTETGFYTVENRNKPLLVKMLQKLWEKSEPGLPWELGEYNEANTLLLDDSPYKALLNPPHTAIFPPSYEHTRKDDDSLGPGGALRSYLEGLADADDVQKYVKENPFGQRPITEKNASWRFYEKVIAAILNTSGNAHNKCRTNVVSDRGNKEKVIQRDIVPDECPESHGERGRDSPSRHILCDTDRRLQRNRVETRGGYWNSNFNHGRACDSPYRQMEVGRRGINWNSEHSNRRANYFPNRNTLCDSDKQDWRMRGAERRGGKWNPDNNHERARYSPYRRTCHDLDRQNWRSGARRQGGGWDSDYNRESVSDSLDHHDRYRSGDAKVEDCRMLIQRWGRSDCNQADNDSEKQPVSDDKVEPSGYSVEHSPLNKKRSGWNSWKCASQDWGKHHVSYDEIGQSSFNKKGSGWNSWNTTSQDRDKHPISYDRIGYSSFNKKGSGWKNWNSASQERDKHPKSYEQTGRRYSNDLLSFDPHQGSYWSGDI